MPLNWPNILTVFRMLLAPVFLLFLVNESPLYQLIALGVFSFAIFTDALDGYLARKLDCVSNFGKFMDPLADKLLVLGGLITLSFTGKIALWIVLVIVLRDVFIMGFRVLAAGKGIYIYASRWGKWKAVVQMALVISIITHGLTTTLSKSYETLNTVLYYCSEILIWVALILTVVSGALYLWRNRQVFGGGLFRD